MGSSFFKWIGFRFWFFSFLGASFVWGESFYLVERRWDDLIQDEPVLYACELPDSTRKVLLHGEKILVNLFDADHLDIDELVVERFEPEVESLKNETPDVATSEGYKVRRRTYRGAYASSYGAYAGPSSSYYYTYSSKEIQRSTSPDLIREVEWAVKNIDIDSIDLKIEQMRLSHRKWTDRTGRMPGSGSSRLIRESNYAYLERLDDFIGAWTELNQAINDYRKKAQEGQMARAETLQQWQRFERNELKALKMFFDSPGVVRIESEGEQIYNIPADSLQKDLILECQVSGRTLYFTLNSEIGGALHPLQLIPVRASSAPEPSSDDPFLNLEK